MNKKIEDYLHLYLGCEAIMSTDHWFAPEGDKMIKIIGVSHERLDYVFYSYPGGSGNTELKYFKPLLRKLDSMTEAENQEWRQLKFSNDFKLKPLYTDADYNAFHYLLSKHFDLFGLIEAGLAIASPSPNTTPSTPNT